MIGLWDRDDCQPEDSAQAEVLTKFMDHLFGVASYHQRYILRHNIRVIKILLDLWKDHVSIDLCTIYDLLITTGDKLTRRKNIDTGN